jgi:hypothetical protein
MEMSVTFEERGPSRAFYVLAGLIFVTGLGVFFFFLFSAIMGMGKELIPIVVPGSKDLELKKPGNYTIFHEYRSVIGNKVSAAMDLSELKVSVVSQATGKEISLGPVMGNYTYKFSGRSGRGVFSFQIDQPGVYTLEAKYPEGRDGPETVLAVGHEFMEKLMVTIFGAIGVLFGSIALSVLILVFTLIKRQRARLKGRQGPGSSPMSPYDPMQPR